MKNKDFAALKRTEILNRMNAAVAENDSEAFSKAYLELCQDIEENVLEQAKELVNQSDMNVLAQRGVRQLTSAEREYYEKVIDAMKSSDPKQALNNIETVFPETIIDSVFEELTTNHPLLSKLNATTVTGLTRMMLNTNGEQKAAWGKLSSKIIEELTSGFKEVDVTQDKLSAFLPVSKAMLAQGAWELLKNTILAPVILLIDLVTGNFDKLKTDASNIWTNIKDAAQTIWTGIKQVVSALAKGLVTAVTTLFTGFRDTVSKIWDSASQAASKAWTAIKGFVANNAKKLKESATEAIQNLKDRASEYWDNIRERTSETWQNVKETVIQYAGNMKDRAVDTFNSVVSGISGALSGVYSAVVNGFSSAISYITGLPGQAVRWGQDFVNGIANGIRSCIGNVTNAVSNVANTIRSWLHFSRPDEGPLHYYEEWMPDFMKGLATGIEKSQGLVADAMKDVQMDMQLDTSSMKPANNLNKTDITGITGMLAQLIQVMSAGQEIYFDNREWAGKLAPAINNELGRIAKILLRKQKRNTTEFHAC